MSDFSAKIIGIDDVKEALKGLVPKLRKRVLRNALAAGARVFRDEAKRLTPQLQTRSQVRKKGTVRNAIAIRTSKTSARNGDIGVFVNVRPAKGASYKTNRKSFLGVKYKTRTLKRASQRGANNPNDPFYWRFLEFGTKKMGKFGFLTKAVGKTRDAIDRITANLTKSLSNINKKGGMK